MSARTAVTLATGRVIEVAGDYATIDAVLTARQLTSDDGKRRLRLADGRQITVHTSVVALVEEVAVKQRAAVGFR